MEAKIISYGTGGLVSKHSLKLPVPYDNCVGVQGVIVKSDGSFAALILTQPSIRWRGLDENDAGNYQISLTPP